MIQRVQTLYSLAALVLLLLMSFLPMAKILSIDGQILNFCAQGIKGPQGQENVYNSLPLMVLLIISVLLTFMGIFLYKKRILQMRICIFNILLMIGLIVLLIYFLMDVKNQFTADLVYQLPIVFPLINMILFYLAFRGIRKDEILIKSYNRIR